MSVVYSGLLCVYAIDLRVKQNVVEILHSLRMNFKLVFRRH